MSNIIKLNGERPMTTEERNSLTMQKDTMVITAICRALGRTDWDDMLKEHNGEPAEIWKRGRWQPYDSGEEVFIWDEKEYLLFHPPAYNIANDKWVQKVEWLRDPDDYVYHTKEDERG
jgi:hypothetical protein